MRSFFHPVLFSISIFLIFPFTLSASETRVEATGGLRTILDDETNTLDFFLDGNPAGLVLLNTKDRFDLSGEWSYSDQEGPWGVNKQRILTTVPRNEDNGIRYEGVMVFPDPHWAFQAAGDLLDHTGIQVQNFVDDTLTRDNYQGLLRVAYGLSFASFGLEILDMETDKAFDPGLYTDGLTSVAGGSGAQNQWLVKGGFITTFPEPTSPHDPRWKFGGYFQTQVGSSAADQTLSLFYAPGTTFPVRSITTTTQYLSWGTELSYELPGTAIFRFAANSTNANMDLEQDSSDPTLAINSVVRHPFDQFQSMNVDGAFRYVLPFTETENLKLGGHITTYLNNTDLIRPGGLVFSNQNLQKIATRFGIGLEQPKEYTLGLQWSSINNLQGVNSLTKTTSELDLNATEQYQLAFGGEQWLGSTWALRLGLVGEVDDDWSTPSHTWTTTLNAGAGVEEAFGRMDVRFWVGQTTDFNNSSNSVELVGAQGSMTLFL